MDLRKVWLRRFDKVQFRCTARHSTMQDRAGLLWRGWLLLSCHVVFEVLFREV